MMLAISLLGLALAMAYVIVRVAVILLFHVAIACWNLSVWCMLTAYDFACYCVERWKARKASSVQSSSGKTKGSGCAGQSR